MNLNFKTFLIGCLLFISVSSFSQKNIKTDFVLKYTDTSGNFNSIYYVLKLKDSTPVNILHRINILAIRKIDERNYIIEKKQLANSGIEKRFYEQISPANNLWKLSPAADKLSGNKAKQNSIFQFTIAVKNIDLIKNIAKDKLQPNTKISFYNDQHIISLIADYQDVENIFLKDDNVLFIDVIFQKPHEELATNGFDLSANKINQVHSLYPLINGSSQNVSIKEQFYDTTDIDLKNRFLPSPLASKNITNHANFIATIIAGAGNSVYYAKGAAWASHISSSSFDQVLPDDTSYYSQENITVQNHSYGTSIDNTYGLNAVAFDKNANENPGLLHVFSSGNSGIETDTAGNYSGIAGFANLTGNFKMAKNILIVGASDSFGVPDPFSSEGPAYDGRIKPELVAFERDGTSESAALVSGTALLLQQFYKTKNNVVLSSALAKAILINSADDVNTPGPDYKTGFGNMNAIKAMKAIDDDNIFSGTIANDSTKIFTINIPANIAKLKVTLVWNDPVATAFAPTALVNDLDLEVVSPSNNSWQPWILNSIPDADSLTALPQRKRDSLNNVEQVSLENPSAGTYQVKVKGYNVTAGNQEFYIVYSLDTLNFFKWYFPSKIDFAEAGKKVTLRWENTFPATGNIEYSLPPDNDWKPVSQNIDLSKKYFKWSVPDTLGSCLLRMKVGNNYFYSDTFLITSLLNPKVGFVCTDSVLFYWEKLKNVDQYQLYQLGEKYMEPYIKVSDTSVFLKINNLSSKYFSVAPVFRNGSAGAKSYAFDYTLQGTGCFIKTFLADPDGNTARLSLSLGTIINVSAISFETLSQSGYETIFNANTILTTDYNFTFQPLKKGVNIFRAKIVLADGQVIYSDNQSVYFSANSNYLVFPVPVSKNNNIEIFTPVPDQETLQLIDVMGRIVLQKQIQFPHEYISTSSLQSGQYFYRITKMGKKVFSGKLIIL